MSCESPAVILFDASSVTLTVYDGVAIPLNTGGLLATGRDGTGKARNILVAADGTTQVGGTVTANLGTIAGVATETTLGAMSAKLPATLGQKTMANSQAVVVASDQSAIPVSQSGAWNIGTVTTVTAVTGITNPVAVTGTFWQATQPVSVASLPLPTGAATEATLATLLTTAAFQARIPVNGQGLMVASVPVVIASDQSAVPVSQSGTWNIGTVTAVTGITNPVAVTGTFWQATQPVSAVALPLPTGAATEATLSTLNGKIPANLTVTATRLLVDGSGVTQPVSGTVAATQSGAWNIGTVTAVTGITNPVAVTGTFWQATQPVSIAATVAVEGTKTNNAAVPGANNVGVLAAIANAAAPSWTEGNLVGLSTDLSGNLRVLATVSGGSGTSSSFGAAFPAAGTAAGFYDGTNMQAARVFDLDSTGGTGYILGVSLRRTTAGVPAEMLGQTVSAASLPVVIASDQSAIPVSQSGTWNIGTVTAVTGITNVVHVDDNAGSLTVDGAITANQGGTWNIGTLTSITNTVTTQGALQNNNAVPGTTNYGVLPALANAAAPSWAEGKQVLLSVDLAGNQRVLATQTGTWNIGTLTTLTSITNVVHVDDNAGSLTVDGSVTVTQATGTNLHMVVDSGTITTVSTVTAVTSITNTVTVQGALTHNNAAPAGTNIGALVALCNTSAPTFTNGDQTLLSVQTDGALRIHETGTGAQTLRAETANGGTSMYRLVAAATNNAQSVKASAGQVYGYTITNVAAYAVWLKFYNKASAPTPGSDASVWVVGVPAGGGANLTFPVPLTFGTGIAIAIVKNPAESDNTSIAANDCVLSLQYT